MRKKIVWKKRKPRMTCEENVAARIAVNRAKALAQQTVDALRLRFPVEREQA